MEVGRPPYEQAYEDYRKGLKTKEIAKKYGVSESTVRSWKNRYWNQKPLQHKKKNVATKSEKRCNAERKVGAPEGNQNAKGNQGGGAPEGNQNNFKHGLYEKLIFETLTEDEKALARDLDINEEMEVRRELRLCDIHIARNMKRIQDTQCKPGGLHIRDVSKTETTVAGADSSKSTHTNTISSVDLILRFENEIQKFRKQKIKCLEILLRMGYDSCKMEIELMKAEAAVQANEGEESPNTNLIEALNSTAKEVWSDE